MTLSYDPDEAPRPSEELFAFAEQAGLHVINVMCDVPGAAVGDHTCVSFAAAVAFLPHKGDRITIEDGRTCEVNRVYFKVARVNNLVSLVPNVLATLLEPPSNKPMT